MYLAIIFYEYYKRLNDFIFIAFYCFTFAHFAYCNKAVFVVASS